MWIGTWDTYELEWIDSVLITYIIYEPMNMNYRSRFLRRNELSPPESIEPARKHIGYEFFMFTIDNEFLAMNCHEFSQLDGGGETAPRRQAGRQQRPDQVRK